MLTEDQLHAAAPVIAALARSYAGRALADDLRQVGWLGVLDPPSPYDPSRSAWTSWVYLRARTEIANYLRARQSRPHEPLPRDVIGADDHPPSARVVALLGRLTDSQARVVELALGLDGGEPRGTTIVGGMLGIRAGVVQRTLTRAIRRLRAVTTEDAP